LDYKSPLEFNPYLLILAGWITMLRAGDDHLIKTAFN
jgi:hypothetical protein